MRQDDADLDQLLAKGDLGGPKYDEIWQNVLAQRAPAVSVRAPWRRWLLVPPVALAAGLGAWLLFVRPTGDAFTAKGETTHDAFAIGCRSAGGSCGPGEKLVFTVNRAATRGYLGAYAERVDDSSRARIWYFPSSTGVSPRVVPGNGTWVAPQAIEIGPEHSPGRYRVTVWVANRALDRSEVDGAGADLITARATLALEVRH